MGELMTERKRNIAFIAIIGLTVLILAFTIYTLLSPQGSREDAPIATMGTSTATASASASEPSADLAAVDELAEGSCTDPATVDRADPQALIKGFTEIAYCWDSTVDPNTTVPILRAQPLMTEEYYQSLDPNVRNSMNADFLAVSESKAYTLPEVTFAPEEAEQMPEGFIAKEVIVDWTWLGRDGYEYKGGRALVTVAAVEEEPGLWAISTMQVNSITSETSLLYSNPTNQ